MLTIDNDGNNILMTDIKPASHEESDEKRNTKAGIKNNSKIINAPYSIRAEGKEDKLGTVN